MPYLTRRMALTAGAAGLVARPARAVPTDLEICARSEGALTWYVAQMSGEAAEAIGRRFSLLYPGITVAVVRAPGQVAYERLQQELKNNTPNCDVFSSSDIAQYSALMKRHALMKYDAVSAGALAAPYRGMGESGYYYPTTASLQVLIYQTHDVAPADVPQRCTDLHNPKFRNRIAIAHPGFSGFFGQWVLAMRRQYGWGFFEKLAANNPRIGRSGDDPISMLSAGECVVGIGPASTATVAARRGNPIGIVYPHDGTVLCVGPSAIMASAPHPNAAKLFMEWLLSPEYAVASRDWALEPVRADAAPLPGMKRIPEIKTISVSMSEIARELPVAIGQWRDTFGN